MTTRRKVLQGLGGAAAAASLYPALQGCAGGSSSERYADAATRTWRHGVLTGLNGSALAVELTRYATLAPSSHNTQCWKFSAAPTSITILPDFTRRCPAVDPDDHHLFVSLGCAAENLIQASAAAGLRGEAGFDALRQCVPIQLAPTPAIESPLFKAIPDRQCTRGEFDGRAVSAAEMRLLESAASSEQVDVLLLTERRVLEQVLEYVVAGNTAQIADPAFVAELKAWIRFNEGAAVRSGDGLYTASSGNPTMPSWLGRRMFDVFFTAKSENDKYARQMRSSAAVAVFVGKTADKANWIEVGRAYQRFALQASALGIRNAMLNQPVEVAHLRTEFAGLLGIGAQRPDLVVRFGRGPKLPASLRRPVSAVMT
jgi:hypothetical protein